MSTLMNFPLPPPWRSETVNDSPVYINDVTGEETSVHPLEQYLSSFETKEVSNGVCTLSSTKESGKSSAQPAATGDDCLAFRCEWKELGLNGNVLSYGMNLCYFPGDKHFEITFDGVHASWVFSKIDGPYGPLDEDDLFLGAKVKVFDRHLTISTANAHICHMIDRKEKLLKKRRAWLQEKIETIGAIPVVKRNVQSAIKHISRADQKPGTANLRRLQNEISRLTEQMGELGLSHMISRMPN
mmetsp:Transcript_10870/g.16555  ORF Transcript_10870/g.16555 Transcript_10870/m.16555 type:complete len:242 (+) Transcript_10870:62-787(+)